jgi:hypothetical protein
MGTSAVTGAYDLGELAARRPDPTSKLVARRLSPGLSPLGYRAGLESLGLLHNLRNGPRRPKGTHWFSLIYLSVQQFSGACPLSFHSKLAYVLKRTTFEVD